MQVKASIKHLQINKANNMIFVVVAVASVITVFSLMSAKALFAQSSYQRRVLGERNKAVKSLKSNVAAANTLKSQYEVFAKSNPNIIGGVGGENTTSDGPRDGDNARIILDALPSQYDFPALISSVEKMAANAHVALSGITGTDEGKDSQTSQTPTDSSSQPTPIEFSINTQTNYDTSLAFIKDLEKSIRPIDITQLSLAGNNGNMAVSIKANTYYQSGITLKIGDKEIK